VAKGNDKRKPRPVDAAAHEFRQWDLTDVMRIAHEICDKYNLGGQKTDMTESQRLVLKWKAGLAQVGWPDEEIKRIVSELCEAGYRQAIEDIQARAAQTDALIRKVAEN
jgi:hypothetical protein